MKVFGGIVLFLAGAVTGGLAAWKLTKDKYSDVIEIINYDPSEREVQNETIEQKTAVLTKEKPSIMDYYKNKKIIENNSYDTVGKKDVESAYLIEEDEFDTLEDYGKETLYLFRDNVLTNMEFDILGRDDVLSKIGEKLIDEIGNVDETVAYIRNTKLCFDYEIILDTRKYADAVRDM